jgi:uncharacterized protein
LLPSTTYLQTIALFFENELGMELTGSTFIAQPRERVWAALNDEHILLQCITGCESMERTDPNTLSAKLAIKLGPVRAKFNGQVAMSNVRELEGYTLAFEGSGGAAGFAKGSSNVALSTVDGGTQVTYTAQASVGGKLGQIGGRMIDAAARGMADDFFAAFSKALTTPSHEQQGASLDASSANSYSTTGTQHTLATTNQVGAIKVQSPVPAQNASKDHRLIWFAAGISVGVTLLLIGKHWL